MQSLLLATSNPHKLEEVRAILAPLEVLGLRDITLPNNKTADTIQEPDEPGATFEENSRIKALYYAKLTNHICLADDSGLEVDALHGAPGVHSAYFTHGAANAHHHSRQDRDAANNAKLLQLLENIPDENRTARFVCVMTAADPQGNILATARGVYEGKIARAPRGENGFGYDPLLLLEDGRTSAQLPPKEKNARSHRAAAARAIAPQLARIPL